VHRRADEKSAQWTESRTGERHKEFEKEKGLWSTNKDIVCIWRTSIKLGEWGGEFQGGQWKGEKRTAEPIEGNTKNK